MSGTHRAEDCIPVTSESVAVMALVPAVPGVDPLATPAVSFVPVVAPFSVILAAAPEILTTPAPAPPCPLRFTSHGSQPNPPDPPLPPPPPPAFSVLPAASPSVPPPPALPGAPRAMLPSAVPFGYPIVVVVCRKVPPDSTHSGVPATPSPLAA